MDMVHGMGASKGNGIWIWYMEWMLARGNMDTVHGMEYGYGYMEWMLAWGTESMDMVHGMEYGYGYMEWMLARGMEYGYGTWNGCWQGEQNPWIWVHGMGAGKGNRIHGYGYMEWMLARGMEHGYGTWNGC